ncbi:hypothetical protein SNK04_000852 [Fusarium graminearum]
MVEQQYIAPGLPQQAGFSGAPTLLDSIPTTAASAYHELAAYSSISSSYNGIPCDPNLLTPVSVIDSPPLHGLTKIQYPPPPSTPNQQPSPPGSSEMYRQQWAGHFDINGQSPSASSPMTSQAPGGGEFLHASYVHDGRRTPGPPEPYMGAFGVSNAPEPPSMDHPYYVDMGPPVDHQVQMGIHHREMPGAPLLSESQPIQYRRRHSPEDPAPQNWSAGVPRSLTGSPRRKPAFQASGRVKSAIRSGQEDPTSEHKNCFGEEAPPKIKSNCPDEERCIFESRWRHRHQKGQDMWDSIQNDYYNRFGKRPGKEMLQMKFKRGRAKYLDWISKDVDLLHEAWLINEKNRYQNTLDIFYEMGGSRNMRLNASDIEIKVVNDLKLEEGIYMESYGSANIRRRRKPDSVRKRAGHGVSNDMSVNDEMMSIGSHTTHEDEVINQVHGLPNMKVEEQGPGDHPNMMETQMWDQQMKMEPGTMPQRNDHIQHSMGPSPISQPMYGARREA